MIHNTFASLRFKNYRLLWWGLFISFIGSQMQVVGIAWHLYDITHSAASLGLIGLVGFLPILVFSLLGGAIVDVYDRRKVLLATEGILTISTTILTVLSFSHTISPVYMYILIAIQGFVTAIDLPARQSYIANIVSKEYLVNALNVNTIGRQTATLIGPTLAGFVIAWVGISYVYAFNAFSFLFFVFMLLQLPSIQIHEEGKKVQVTWKTMKEGLSFILHSPMIWATMVLDFAANFFAAASVIFPIFAKDILHVGPEGLGFLYAAPAVGAVIAGLLFGAKKTIHHQGSLLLWVVGAYSVATIGFGLSKNIFLSLLFLALLGGSDMVSMVIRRTISQLATPDTMRGRMNAISQIFFIGGPFLGESEAGFAAALLGGPLSVVLGGVGALLVVLGITWKVPQLRDYDH